jgi:hypothetical protein
MLLPPNAWRRMLSAASVSHRAIRGVSRHRALATRRLLIESLEARQLLATLTAVDTSDVLGTVTVDSSYQVAGVTTEATEKTAQFSGLSIPSSALVEIDRGTLLGAYGDASTGSIERQVGAGLAHVAIDGTAGAVQYTETPADITARTSSVSYDIGTSAAIALRIDPEAGESVGDMVGVLVDATAVGQLFGVDMLTTPSGSVSVVGAYSYQYRILSATSTVLSTHSGSGAVSYNAAGEATLEDFETGPINVPIGSQIEISLRITGSVATSDLNASGQVHANLTFDVSLTKADLSAESLAWNVSDSTDQSQRMLDFTYYIDGAQAPVASDTVVEFYWASGDTMADVIGSADSPSYSYSIDTDVEKTAGSHAGSVALSLLGDMPADATTLLMVVDRQDAIAEVTDTNNLKTVAVLPEVELTGIAWNTRRQEDPYGGWRGLDVQYEVQSPMSMAGAIVFYWASGTTFDTRIGDALSPRGNDVSLGLHQFNESANWGERPDGASYVLAVFDPDNIIQEWDEGNNVLAIQVHTAAEILNGALNLNPLSSAASTTSLTVWFQPGGGKYTMSEAEVALGIDHFNWYQQVQNVPGHWTLYQDQTTGGKASAASVMVDLPWIDPSNEVPNQSYLVLASSRAGGEERFASNLNDSAIYYYNEPGVDHTAQVNVCGVTGSAVLSFTDAPRVPSEYLAAGESWQFVTAVVGVDADGQMVTLPLASQCTFTWKSNTVYDRDTSTVTGGGIFLQALDESVLPTALSGGIFDVSLVSDAALVAAADASSTVANTPVSVRVTANDYDSLDSTLRILWVGSAEHGTVTIVNAGTADDWSDDYVLYTPNDGYVGQDRFQYLISRLGDGLGVAAAEVTIDVTPALDGLGAVGDTLSDEYTDLGLTYAQSWVELMAKYTASDLGASGSWNAPRDDGYEYNWAQSGAISQSSLVAAQVAGLSGQIAAGDVSYVVVALGQEDFLPGTEAYAGIYFQGLSGGWSDAQIDACADTVVASLETALAAFKDAGAQAVVLNLIDFGSSPAAMAAYPDATRRALVASVVADINVRIEALAGAYRVPLADVAGAAKVVLGSSAAPVESAAIGGLAFTNTAGVDPSNLFTADGMHPHTIVAAVYANVILEAFQLGYSAAVSPMSESEMVTAAGLTYGGLDTLNLDYPAYVVLPENQLPVAVADTYVAHEGTPFNADAAEGVLSNDRDADADTLRAVVVNGGPSHGTLTLAANGSFTYLPTTGFVGTDSFSYTASDGYGNSASVTVQITVLAQGVTLGDGVGLFDAAEAATYLRNSTTAGAADQTVYYGAPGANWVLIVGDWDGTGTDTLGLYDPEASVFYLANSASGAADLIVAFGVPGAGWTPIAGDWNGDGQTTFGLYDPQNSVFYLTDSLASGVADRTVPYGAPGAGWTPLAGDWTGQGFDTLGLYDPNSSMFYLRDSNTPGLATISFGYGPAGAGWTPVVGDWNGDGVDSIGLYDASTSSFLLRNSNTAGFASIQFGFGQPSAGWTPVAGDWDGTQPAASSATSTVATAQNATSLNASAVDSVDLAAIADEAVSTALREEADDNLSLD